MVDDAAQLKRLLSTADHGLLRRVADAVLPDGRPPMNRPRATCRRAVFDRLRRRGRIAEAVRFLTGGPDREFIPRRRWRLDELVGVGEAVLHHRHFRRGQEHVLEHFDPGPARICLFLPCHRVKPYSLSPTVAVVRETLEERGLRSRVAMAVASVPGIVPLAMDRRYPFAYYEWDPILERKDVILAYTAAVRARAGAFLRATRGRFDRYLAYFRPGSVELDALAAAAGDEGVVLEVVPTRETVAKVIAIDRAVWRFAGLKRRECLEDLCGLIDAG